MGRYWELHSAMQKSVRRGLEEDTGRFFFELAEEGYFAAAANRLRVFAFEDIGLGDPNAVLFAEISLNRAYVWHKEKNGAWRIAAANAILALCRAKKTRLSDHFQAVCRGKNITEDGLAIPDYALDKHTQRGKRIGRGWDHFRQEASKLENIAVDVQDTYEDDAFKFWESASLARAEVQDLAFLLLMPSTP